MSLFLWRSAVAVALDKPAGLATQAPHPHPSLESTLRLTLGDSVPYVAFPHRIDRPVSGVVLAALTKSAARRLGQQFESRKIKKTYLAWIEGQWTSGDAENTHRWIDWLRKVPDEPRGEIVSADHPGASIAETDVRVLRTTDRRTLVELSPITGRMHQLRIQCAARGYPIVGDTLYGSSDGLSELPGAAVIALHSLRIEFHDPTHGKKIAVTAPIPDTFPTQH